MSPSRRIAGGSAQPHQAAPALRRVADACRRERYIGVCYGPPGVGKTVSAHHDTHWDQIGEWLTRFWLEPDGSGPEVLATANSVLWTPTVTVTPCQLYQQVPMLCRRFSAVVEHHRDPHGGRPPQFAAGMWNVELFIVDESDRLKPAGLEQLRDNFDRIHRLLSVHTTCRLQRRPLHDYLTDALTAHARGDPAPLLT